MKDPVQLKNMWSSDQFFRLRRILKGTANNVDLHRARASDRFFQDPRGKHVFSGFRPVRSL